METFPESRHTSSLPKNSLKQPLSNLPEAPGSQFPAFFLRDPGKTSLTGPMMPAIQKASESNFLSPSFFSEFLSDSRLLRMRSRVPVICSPSTHIKEMPALLPLCCRITAFFDFIKKKATEKTGYRNCDSRKKAGSLAPLGSSLEI